MLGFAHIIRLGVREGTYGRTIGEYQFTYNDGRKSWVRTFDGGASLAEFLRSDAAIPADVVAAALEELRGAGKTTIFNLMTGVYTPDEGAIELDGKFALGYSNLGLAYLKMGESDKAGEELNQMKRIAKESSEDDQATSSMERLLFTVRLPGANAAKE